MKKIALTACLMLFCVYCFAQDDEGSPMTKGNIVIEVNTGFGEASTANTALYIKNGDGGGTYGIGGEFGYFLLDNFALKVGLGYQDPSADDNIASEFNWKLGAKYYIASKFPFQADINGAMRTYGDDPVTANTSALWFGVQGGYAWLLADNVSLEPGLRYATPLNDDAGDDSVFGLNIGFNIYF